MSYVLGIDLGTSSLKGLLASKDGEIIITAQSSYPLINPKPGYSEQDPCQWINAAKIVIKEIISKVPDAKNKIEAISFSGQMHSLVLLDENDNVLRNAILWNDVRTTDQCRQIEKTLGADLIKITKNRALEGFTLPKLLWVLQNENNVWKKARHFLLPKDYLGFCFTGNKQMEYSDAAGTLILDIEKKMWSKEIISAFNLPENIFPKLVDSTACIGSLKDDIAKELGITNIVKIFSGGADNAAAAVGAGILDESTGLSSIGTSGVFLSYEGSKVKNYEGRLHFFNHIIKDSFYSMGVSLCAGNSLSWFKDNFAKDISYDEIFKEINNIGENSRSLLFTPYLVGERTPYVDGKIRASFIGLDISHNIYHLAKAVIEGITFSIKDSIELMKKYANKKIDKIVAVGGGAKNEYWLQMQADIFDAKIITLLNEQGPGLGAVMVAAVGAGWYENFELCAKAMVKYSKEYLPNAKKVQSYKKLYELYNEVYPATRQLCSLLREED
jgi:xylulokinase